jgi:hypothetical protein
MGESRPPYTLVSNEYTSGGWDRDHQYQHATLNLLSAHEFGIPKQLGTPSGASTFMPQGRWAGRACSDRAIPCILASNKFKTKNKE